MKYVIDSSVAFKWSIKEADSDKADAILNDFLLGTHELHAPDFYPVELAHRTLTQCHPRCASAFMIASTSS
jgi:predicted nucleic acid-binding protein